MFEEHSRVIVHLDIDAFYAQVEEMLSPELKNKPLGIYQKTIIVTSNYVAREYGIKKCMLKSEAIKLCPNLILVCGENIEKYREISQNITSFIQNNFRVSVEKLGFDENFIDVTRLVSEKTSLNKHVIEKYTEVEEDEDDSESELSMPNANYDISNYRKRKYLVKQNNSKRSKLDGDQGVEHFEPSYQKLEHDEVEHFKLSYQSNSQQTFCSQEEKKDHMMQVLSRNYNKVNGHIYKNIKGKCSCGCIEKLIIGTHIANDIRAEIFKNFKLTLSAGISYNKMLSKLVGSLHKPNQQTVIFPNAVLDLLSEMNLRQIPGVGSKMYEKLGNLCIKTVEQLQNTNKNILAQEFDHSTSEWLLRIAFGKDDSSVKNYKKQNTISVEDRYPKPIKTLNEFKVQVKILLERLVRLVIKDGRTPKLLKIQLRFDHFKYVFKFDTKQCQINPSVFTRGSNVIIEYLVVTIVKLYNELSAKKKSTVITYINIALGNFIEVSKSTIMNFFEKQTLSSENVKSLTNVTEITDSICRSQNKNPTSNPKTCSSLNEIEMNNSRTTFDACKHVHDTGSGSSMKSIESSVKGIFVNLERNDCNSTSKSNNGLCHQSSSWLTNEDPSYNSIDQTTLKELSNNLRKEIASSLLIHKENKSEKFPLSLEQKESGEKIGGMCPAFNVDDLGAEKSSTQDLVRHCHNNHNCQKEIKPFNEKNNDCDLCLQTTSDVLQEQVASVNYGKVDLNFLRELPDDIRVEIENDLKQTALVSRASSNPVEFAKSSTITAKTESRINSSKKSIKQLSMLNFVKKKS